MRSILKVAGVVIAVLVALGIGFVLHRIGHPTGPEADQYLPSSQPAPGGLEVRFLGATTLVFSDGANDIMIDGFVSRPDIKTVLTGEVASDPGRISRVLSQAKIQHVNLLFVSHSHYDHVLDAPAIVNRTGPLLVGSASTLNIGRGAGLAPDRMREIRGGEVFQAGRFKVTVFRSLHSAGDRVPGSIDVPLSEPAEVKAFRQGGTFSYLVEHDGARILVHASSNFVPGMYQGVRADTVFLATGGLGGQSDAFAKDYWRDVVQQTGARLVVPIHWDDFLRPLDQPILPMRRFMDDFPKAMSKIEPLAAHDGVSIRYMPVIAPVDIEAVSQSAETPRP